jgi:hypothetical protein
MKLMTLLKRRHAVNAVNAVHADTPTRRQANTLPLPFPRLAFANDGRFFGGGRVWIRDEANAARILD